LFSAVQSERHQGDRIEPEVDPRLFLAGCGGSTPVAVAAVAVPGPRRRHRPSNVNTFRRRFNRRSYRRCNRLDAAAGEKDGLGPA
jgi:hypothetical protein